MNIKILKSLIQHRPTPLAIQTSGVNKGAHPQAASTEERQAELLEQHLRGEVRVGAYTTIPGASLVRWCCYDLDGGSHSDKNALENPDLACDLLERKLSAAGVPVLRERSGGGGGWHLWVVFDRLVPAVDVRDWMRGFLKDLDLKTRAGERLDYQRPKGIELFPKQDMLGDDDSGNLVWLPGWGQAPDGNLYADGKVVTSHVPVYHLDHKAPEIRQREAAQLTEAQGLARVKDVKAWLNFLDPDDYDIWIKAGMALNTWMRQGGGQGLALWIQWSKQSEKYRPGDCEDKWDSFRREDGQGSAVVSVASLKYAARERGWCEIKRMSQVEIANHILDGEVFDGADLWLYCDERGVWRRVKQYEIERRVCDLDGLEIPGKDENAKPKILNVTDALASSVARISTRVVPEIDPDVWTSQVGFACANGWVTPSGLEALRREHYAREQLCCAYDPKAKAPRWVEFLSESCDEESALVLQEFVGAALFGDATTYNKALVLWGDGGNGKSVFADTIRRLFDPVGVSSYTPHQFGDAGIKADLRLKKFNVVMELPERELLDTSSLKAIVTGDAISARRPYDIEPLTFESKAAHLFCCNVLPDTRNTDKGFWRRWITVGFTREPAIPDPHLKQKLGAELSGIVAWAVAGYARLRAQGRYTEPSSAVEIKRVWAHNTNPVGRFFEQVVIKSDERETPSNKVYAAYSRWCDLSGLKPVGAPKFGQEVKRHIESVRNSKGVHYRAELRPESQWSLVGE